MTPERPRRAGAEPAVRTSEAPRSGGSVEPRALEDLAAASRILADQGVFDAAGHFSMRHPHHPERFLMSRSLALVTVDDIMEFDLDGVGCDARPGFLERFIHAEVYRRRPDVMAVAHSHSASVIPFGLVGTPMRAMYHNAAFLAAGVPVFDIRERFGATDIVVRSPEKGAALAEALGDKAVVLLRAPGMVVVGPSVPSTVFRAIFTEVNARLQLQATVARRTHRCARRGGGPSRRRGESRYGRPRLGAVEAPRHG